MSAIPADETQRQACDLRVRLGSGIERLHGRLSVPPHATTVFLLVPGATYDSSYWDFPYQPQTYSQVRSLNQAGYATFNIDPFGNGDSSRPASARLTAVKEANVLHQVVRALRSGKLGETAFRRVVLMSHSLGSTVSAIEAAVYRDVDGVVLTGFTHRFNVRAATSLFMGGFHPARRDPAFAGRVRDPGYLTTRPGKRARHFHSQSDPVPEVVAVDERTKGMFSIIDVPDAAVLATILPVTRRINVPVQLAVGSEDVIMCGPRAATHGFDSETLLAGESRYFGAKARLSAFVLPGAGHNLTLARDTQRYQRAVIAWAHSFVGS